MHLGIMHFQRAFYWRSEDYGALAVDLAARVRSDYIDTTYLMKFLDWTQLKMYISHFDYYHALRVPRFCSAYT